MNPHYDALETRSAEEREAALMAALPRQIAHAKSRAPGFGEILAKFDPAAINSRRALATLPVTRKSDLGELQAKRRPLPTQRMGQSVNASARANRTVRKKN